jgi:hypothetical protein
MASGYCWAHLDYDGEEISEGAPTVDCLWVALGAARAVAEQERVSGRGREAVAAALYQGRHWAGRSVWWKASEEVRTAARLEANGLIAGRLASLRPHQLIAMAVAIELGLIPSPIEAHAEKQEGAR